MMAGFAAEIAAALAEGRELAESRMRTTVALQFQVGYEPDPETDADVPAYETFVETPARIKAPGNMIRESEAGGRTAAETTRELHVPVSTPDPWSDPRCAAGVTALVLEVDPTDDPSLLGTRVRLSGPAPGSQTTARRLQITEVVA